MAQNAHETRKVDNGVAKHAVTSANQSDNCISKLVGPLKVNHICVQTSEISTISAGMCALSFLFASHS